jgi:hypothetical protein
MKPTAESVVPLAPRIISLSNWLEDCARLYIRLIRSPAGIGYPDPDSPDTIQLSVEERIQVGSLDQHVLAHTQDNMWRSWQLYSDALCSNPVSYIPVNIDIDNEQDNLRQAHVLTQDCLGILEKMSHFHGPDRLRVVFSGKKGFHIEARPTEPLDFRSVRGELLRRLAQLRGQNGYPTNSFSDGIIDTGHDFIRVTGSFNSWRDGNVLKRRKVIQLSSDDFRKSQLQEILERSEAA